MELEKTVELGLLLDTYGVLLTDRMKDILSMYVYDNLSLQEIATYFNISKPAVLDAIRTSSKKLEFYESKIKMLDLKKSLEQFSKSKDFSKNNLQNLLKKY